MIVLSCEFSTKVTVQKSNLCISTADKMLIIRIKHFQTQKTKISSTDWSDKGFKGTVVDRALLKGVFAKNENRV